MTVWEIAIAGLSLALIGALLALRLADVVSGGPSRGKKVAGQSATPGDDPADAPESVADEDRVVELLSAHDGSLRQQVLVDRTDWSKSKVSRLLSRMEERGTIRKVSVGRENAIELARPEGSPEDGGDGDG